MALRCAIPTPYGCAAEYHRIVSSNTVFDEKTVRVELHGFINAEARQRNARPLVTMSIDVPMDEIGVPDPTRHDLYRYLAKNQAFAGSQET